MSCAQYVQACVAVELGAAGAHPNACPRASAAFMSPVLLLHLAFYHDTVLPVHSASSMCHGSCRVGSSKIIL